MSCPLVTPPTLVAPHSTAYNRVEAHMRHARAHERIMPHAQPRRGGASRVELSYPSRGGAGNAIHRVSLPLTQRTRSARVFLLAKGLTREWARCGGSARTAHTCEHGPRRRESHASGEERHLLGHVRVRGRSQVDGNGRPRATARLGIEGKLLLLRSAAWRNFLLVILESNRQ